MSWTDLIADVRAQIDVTDDQAYGWLLERARLMNAESDWLLTATSFTSDGTGTITLPTSTVKIEAVTVDGRRYERATLSQLDNALANAACVQIYGEDGGSYPTIRISPAPVIGAAIEVRSLADVPDDRAGAPPFPLDITPALADGAIATGLARMDERFDSAGYFEARFTDAIARLRRRRHGRVGRGGVRIRLVR